MTFPAHLPQFDGLLSETESASLRLRFAELCKSIGIDERHPKAEPIYFDLVSDFLSGWSGGHSAEASDRREEADRKAANQNL
jgi:hypothetical protein